MIRLPLAAFLVAAPPVPPATAQEGAEIQETAGQTIEGAELVDHDWRLFGFSVEVPEDFGEFNVSTPIALEGRGVVLEANGSEGSIAAMAIAFGIDRVDEV